MTDAPMFSSDRLRAMIIVRHLGRSYAAIARDLGVSDEALRQFLLGQREPGRRLQLALGFKRVSFYRGIEE